RTCRRSRSRRAPRPTAPTAWSAVACPPRRPCPRTSTCPSCPWRGPRAPWRAWAPPSWAARPVWRAAPGRRERPGRTRGQRRASTPRPLAPCTSSCDPPLFLAHHLFRHRLAAHRGRGGEHDLAVAFLHHRHRRRHFLAHGARLAGELELVRAPLGGERHEGALAVHADLHPRLRSGVVAEVRHALELHPLHAGLGAADQPESAELARPRDLERVLLLVLADLGGAVARPRSEHELGHGVELRRRLGEHLSRRGGTAQRDRENDGQGAHGASFGRHESRPRSGGQVGEDAPGTRGRVAPVAAGTLPGRSWIVWFASTANARASLAPGSMPSSAVERTGTGANSATRWRRSVALSTPPPDTSTSSTRGQNRR